MFPTILYVLFLLATGSVIWAFHMGPQSQLLVLLMGLLVFPLQKFIHKAPLKDLGFRRCTLAQLTPGILLPIAMLGAVASVAMLLGEARLASLGSLGNPFSGAPVTSLGDLLGFFMINGAILFLLEFVTEELMFRGYLLGKLATLGEVKGLVLASAIFGMWHLPIAIWGIGGSPVRTLLYVGNMALLGAVLGLLFLESRSLIPVAAFHAVWNTLEYNLFGFMDQQGLLIGRSRTLFDAEEGWIGTVVLLLTVTTLWVRWNRRGRERPNNEVHTLAEAEIA